MATAAPEKTTETLSDSHIQTTEPNPTAQIEDPSSPVTSSILEQQPPLNSISGEDAKKVPAAAKVNGGDGAPVNSIEKKIKRAERFGVPVKLSEEEKRNSRAERFGTVPTVGATKASEDLKRKARAERFGLVKPVSTDDEAKKKSRLERFGPVKKPDSLEEEKKKERAIRFSEKKDKTTVIGKASGVA